MQGRVRQRALRTLPRDSAFAATEDLLLFVLSYLKSNPLQAVHAARHWPDPASGQCLAAAQPTLATRSTCPITRVTRPDQALSAVLAQHPRVLLDVTERCMPRSIDADTQREHYSGKKKIYLEK